MAETPSGMLNSIGLQGPGIDAFVEKDLAWLKSTGARALVSIAGNTAEEFGDVAEALARQPGLRRRRGRRGQHLVPQRRQPRAGLRLRPAVVGAGGARSCASGCPRGTPVFAKLTPDVTDIVSHRPRLRSRPAPTG